MDVPSYPTPPNAAETAAAQSKSNRDTAITQYGLNATNQVTPWGSSSYKQIGTWEDGTPRYEQTTSLSPTEQGLFDLNQQTRTNLGNIGVEQSGRMGELLNTPFDINAGRANELSDINKTFMDPQWAQNEEATRTRLINSGVRPGSEAYDREMRNFSDQKQQGYNRMFLDSYGQANQAALTERNQPINEISALLSGSQVSQPNFQKTPTAGVAPTDVIGATNAQYQGEVGQYNAAQANQRAMMSGLMGLGSTALGGWMLSDRRTKEDIKKVGSLDDGTNLYKFRYKGDGEAKIGVMAQEVETTHPEAVADAGGVKIVNYSRLAEALG